MGSILLVHGYRYWLGRYYDSNIGRETICQETGFETYVCNEESDCSWQTLFSNTTSSEKYTLLFILLIILQLIHWGSIANNKRIDEKLYHVIPIHGLSSWQPIHSPLPSISSNNGCPSLPAGHPVEANTTVTGWPNQSLLCLLPQQSHWSSHQVNKDYNSLQIHSHQLYGHRGCQGNSTVKVPWYCDRSAYFE